VPVLTYLDFDLLIERAGDRYRARVLSSPGGNASRTFDLPFSREQLQIFVLTATGLGKRRKVRRIESPEMQAIKTFGSQLFEAVFDEGVHDCLRLSLHDTERDGVGLRIRLRLDDSVDGETRVGATEDDETVALCDVPWEFLYDTGGPGFLCLSSASPVVRYQDLRRPIERIAVQPPLRILVTICGPSDAVDLDVEFERARVAQALGGLVQDGLVTIDWLEPGTLEQLQRRLRLNTYHAFHFIGHGGYDPAGKEGVLLFETAKGRSDPVSSESLRALFQNHQTLQLAVLNACEGARTDPTDPFAGVAQNLLHGGVNAVIAMQFEISDDAAIVLSSEFYTALADGLPVDAALAEARTAVFTRASAVEWAIPVLYLRSPDAAIFDVATLPPRRDIGEEDEEDKEEERKRTAPPRPIDDSDTSELEGGDDGGETDEETKSLLRRISLQTKLLVAAALAVIVAAVVVVVVALGGGPLDGDILFVRDGDIFAFDPDSLEETLLVEDADANDFAPSVSPDQSQVVFGGGPDEDIFIADIDGGTVENLTDSPGIQEESADWSSQGPIVFDSDETGTFEIYSINADGSGKRQLTDNTWDDKRPEWSPEGDQIAFESRQFGGNDIHVMDADGENERSLTETEADEGVPAWSPDGDQIAYRSNDLIDRADFEVWVMGAARGEDPHAVTHDIGTVRAPTWSPDGNEIVFSSGGVGNHGLSILDLETGEWRSFASAGSNDRGPVWCCF
jgi:hypothetical protein